MAKDTPKPLQLSLFSRYPTNYQSNLFTESRQEFSELEKKIVTLVVNQLGNKAVQGQIQPNVNVVVTVPYSELTKAHHHHIAEAAEALSKKRISYKDIDNSDFIHITPFPYVKSLLVGGRRLIEIKMLADVVPHFAALGQRYTKYDLDIMLSLSSVYAQRMFEIVSMNFHIQKMRFTYVVDELRNILNCPAKYRYHDFKVNVLEVAQRELRQKANLLLEWQPYKKQGKQVIELEFQIKTAEQIAGEGVKRDQRIISSLPIHEAIALAWQVMAQYALKPWQKDLIASEFSLLETLMRVHSEFENGLRPTVKNRTSYLIKSLGIENSKPQKPVKSDINQQQLTLLSPSYRTTAQPNLASNQPTSRSQSTATDRARTDQSVGSVLSSIVEQLKPNDNAKE